MGMGVVQYCTAEGGSGFIANPSLPWLSSFNITQQSPVYDQETAWLRDSPPGTYTNYSRFGPPYSVDGGVLPPYTDSDASYTRRIDLPPNSVRGDFPKRRRDEPDNRLRQCRMGGLSILL
jgi:hypothetical protein